MKTKTIITCTFVLATTLGCGYSKSLDAEGETEGDPKPNQAEPDGEDPPEWHCRPRIPKLTYVVTQPASDNVLEAVVDAHDAEVCAYAHASDFGDAIPPKPSWWGLPDLAADYMANFDPNANEETELHPVWTWMPTIPGTWEISGGDLRSGLIGNFALWTTFAVPDEGPRPPIVTGTVFDQIAEAMTRPPLSLDPFLPNGNPSTTGRYPAYGYGCSTQKADSTTGVIQPVWDASRQDAQECEALIEHLGVTQLHPLYPMYPDYDAALEAAVDATQCLDNGGEYSPVLAKASAPQRNGLVWLNFSEIDKLYELILSFVGIPPEVVEMLENVTAFLDWMESIGFQWNLWPRDPTWPWSNWSFTGMCGHPARLAATSSGQIVTNIPCPISFVPILPDIDFEFDPEFPEEADFFSAEGYCTLPMRAAPLHAGITLTPVDDIAIGKKGHGFSGAIYVEPLSDASLDTLSESLDVVETHDGVVVNSSDTVGDTLLQAFSVPSGSKIIATADLVNPSAADLLRVVVADLASGRTSMLLLDAPDGRRLHRYLVPVPDAWLAQ